MIPYSELCQIQNFVSKCGLILYETAWGSVTVWTDSNRNEKFLFFLCQKLFISINWVWLQWRSHKEFETFTIAKKNFLSMNRWILSAIEILFQFEDSICLRIGFSKLFLIKCKSFLRHFENKINLKSYLRNSRIKYIKKSVHIIFVKLSTDFQ